MFLIAHQVDRLGLRTDEGDTTLLAHFGKLTIFRKKAKAGMYCLDPRTNRGRQDILNVEIRILGTGTANTDCLVRKLDVETFAINRGVDGNRLDSKFMQ